MKPDETDKVEPVTPKAGEDRPHVLEGQVVQPARKTERIATEMVNRQHPEKPAVIEHPEAEAQLTSATTLQDQKPSLE